MIRKIDHVVITTANINACINFYEKLGFTARSAGERYELYAGDFKINVHLFGKELEPHAGIVQPGSTDLCFEIDNRVEDLQTMLKANGITDMLGIVDRTGVRGKMRSIYLRDPDQNLVEFCRYE